MSKETTVPMAKQVSSTDGAGWSWVERRIWNDRMLAALVNGVKGGKWFSLIDKVWRPSTLAGAWERVRANKGAAGIDEQSVQAFEAQAERYLHELSEALQDGSYTPQAVRRKEIPKGGGKVRPLGIPTVKDRVVQTAVKRVVEPIFEQLFEPTSYGFRPKRSCKDALREVDGLLRDGYVHVVDADIQSYFDCIPHDKLCAQLEQIISDGRLLALIQGWLSQEIVGEMARWTPTQGTPQGAVISPLLANLYLHPLDVRLRERGYRMVRFADDFVILCRDAAQAEQALAEVQAWMEEAELTLHPDKTHVVDYRAQGQGFDFLGYRFESGRRGVRDKSRKALRAKIKKLTKRSCGQGLARVIARLNPILRGWYNYFKHAFKWELFVLDGYVRRRLRAILRKQEKRPGMGGTHADHKRWPNAYFARAGLFTMKEAWLLDVQSR